MNNNEIFKYIKVTNTYFYLACKIQYQRKMHQPIIKSFSENFIQALIVQKLNKNIIYFSNN